MAFSPRAVCAPAGADLVPMASVRKLLPGRFQARASYSQNVHYAKCRLGGGRLNVKRTRAPRPRAFSVHQVVVKRPNPDSLLSLSSEILVMAGEKARHAFPSRASGRFSCGRDVLPRPRPQRIPR